MRRRLCTAAVCFLLLAGAMVGQQWTDWVPTSDAAGILYRWQAFANANACYLEFRDSRQKGGNTTFDAAVNYKYMDPNGQLIAKSETEHMVVTSGHDGTARISNCSSVAEVRASLIQRH